MYNNTNNNMNPLFSLLGLTGGGQGGQSQSQPQPPAQSGGGMDQSNPLIQLLTAMMGGQNAMNALQNILPSAAQYTQNNRGNQSMEQFVRNEYNNRGIDINGAMEQLQQLMNAMGTSGGQNNYGGQSGYNTNGGQGGYNTSSGTQQNNNNY